ncbi:MAG TPA: right-handed parallel beta-helix repeat-containing protein, partial [Mycobacteriales bacterium]|nr:right-handed parallel beta-helix repeat-containing protein [Mycobacteriales bacterium]
SSNLRNPTNVFGDVGTLTVSLNVTDDGGATDTVSHPITITANQPPVASFTYAPVAPRIHDLVTFTDTSTDDDGVVSESWLIDRVQLSGPVVKVKACPPAMNVTLDAFDHAGQSGEATDVIPVSGSIGDVHVPAGADLNAAIASACPGDRLVLDAGHYTGGVQVPAQITIRGAGMGATFIDGPGSDPNHWVLYVTPGATISDLTVTGGGIATGPVNNAGGGIFVVTTVSTRDAAAFSGVELTGNGGNGAMIINDQVELVTITHSSFHDNRADFVGGTAAIAMSCCATVVVDHSEFAHNTGDGTIRLGEANGVSFVANDVHDNTGVALGIQVSAGPAGTLREVLLSRFVANGGGMVSDLELLFAGNLVARNRGFGVSAGHATELQVVNSTIADNSGFGLGAGIVAFNSIVAGNGTDLDGPLGGGGNNLVGGTPGFVGGGDYHLAPGSPAIDRGDNSAVPASLTVDA